MYKKSVIIKVLVMSMISATSFAQNIGINATGAIPDSSAALDVNVPNKGILIPRVALTAKNISTPIVSPETSLMVYNTATAGTFPNSVTPGYYYWDGSLWVKLAPEKYIFQTYNINNVQDDYVQNFNTKINSNKYILFLTGIEFNETLDSPPIGSGGGDFSSQNVKLFRENDTALGYDTWRIAADYPSVATAYGDDGNWKIHLVIIPAQGQFNPDINIDLGGGTTNATITTPLPTGVTN